MVGDAPVLGVATTASGPMLDMTERPLKHRNGALKAVEDYLVGAVMIAVLAPVMAGHMPYNDVADCFVRHRVKPGLTGWAQVNGSRGEIDSLEKAERRVALDLAYIDSWLLWLDFKIMLMTIHVIFSGRDAY
ncbi:MAG: hypothetical protein FJX59_10095 [Alphaproteobacteria bacterium]|nr:hypothetical protein [Alphaproteobacteria bacterium]